MRSQKHIFILVIISTLITSAACAPITAIKQGCSDNWKLTGYYTPVEDDLLGFKHKISIINTGVFAFRNEFLRQIRVEGWGKTRYGWYLGYYNKAWHKSNYPLNSKGQILKKGMVAVDTSMVPLSTKLRIPGLYELMGQQSFIASDVGVGVRGKHIDIYTGEGGVAKQLAYKITGQSIVCL